MIHSASPPEHAPETATPEHRRARLKPVPADRPAPVVELVASARLPTRYGTFTIHGFRDLRDGKEHTALVHGQVDGARDCPVRVHSECHTGDVWGSLRCDCREQLEEGLKYVQSQTCGVVIYLRQEGRGIGLFNKMKAYCLQDEGLDTVEANLHLGLPNDSRDYSPAADMLRVLGVRSVALLTNNPEKIDGLQRAGLPVVRRIPVSMPANEHNRRYLTTKKKRLGHLLEL